MKRAAILTLVTTASWAATGSLVHRVPTMTASATNPLEGNPQAVLAGAKLYAQECAACHGPEREGRVGPPLSQPEVTQAAAGVLFWILRNGSLRTGMPSFAHLPGPQRWQIVTFLRSSCSGGGRRTSAPAGKP